MLVKYEPKYQGEGIGLWLRIMKAVISDSKIFMALLHTDLYETSFALHSQKHPMF